MKSVVQKLLRPGSVWWALAACLMIVIVVGWVATRIEHRIIRSRTVTQEQVARGWSASGLAMTTHTISRGENFWKVARQYGVDIDTVVGANPGLTKLQAATGQKIRVPNRRGAVHVTQKDDRLPEVAAAYGAPADAVASVNNLGEKHILPEGLELFIPGAKPQQLAADMDARYRLRGIFGSPLTGRITSTMGMRKHPVGGFRGKHTGLDLAAPSGSRIAAAAAGTVTETGEGEYIGKYAIIAHQDGYTTLYGHCSEVLVRSGQKVKKGQIIARVGMTGRTTGPHLHFEIRKNGAPQDPLAYLW